MALSKTDDVPQLTGKTMYELNLLPTNVQETDQGADAIKTVLGNLKAIPYTDRGIRRISCSVVPCGDIGIYFTFPLLWSARQNFFTLMVRLKRLICYFYSIK